MSEVYVLNGVSRQVYDPNSNEGQALFSQLTSKFPWVNIHEYFGISSATGHEVLGEPVITCNIHQAMVREISSGQNLIASRKFCMNSATSFIRLYGLFTDQKPAWMPPSVKVMCKGVNLPEINRFFPALADSFHDLYFSGDPDEVEAAFSLPRLRGEYETFYGATVVDGQPVRVKQYLYNEQAGFSDWDVVFYLHCKMAGRLDLL